MAPVHTGSGTKTRGIVLTPDMEIRDATVEDSEAIQRVAERSWRADYPEIVSRETAAEGVTEWYSADVVREEIERPDARVSVATVDGDVVGFVHAIWTDAEGDVLRLYVDPDHRGEGIGSALLERTVDRLFDEGVDAVAAMVLADNEPGKEFYRAHGFERVGESTQTEIAGEYYEEATFRLDG